MRDQTLEKGKEDYPRWTVATTLRPMLDCCTGEKHIRRQLGKTDDDNVFVTSRNGFFLKHINQYYNFINTPDFGIHYIKY